MGFTEENETPNANNTRQLFGSDTDFRFEEMKQKRDSLKLEEEKLSLEPQYFEIKEDSNDSNSQKEVSVQDESPNTQVINHLITSVISNSD